MNYSIGRSALDDRIEVTCNGISIGAIQSRKDGSHLYQSTNRIEPSGNCSPVRWTLGSTTYAIDIGSTGSVDYYLKVNTLQWMTSGAIEVLRTSGRPFLRLKPIFLSTLLGFIVGRQSFSMVGVGDDAQEVARIHLHARLLGSCRISIEVPQRPGDDLFSILVFTASLLLENQRENSGP